MYGLLRPLLFRLDPERAHNLTLRALQWAGRTSAARSLLARQFASADARLEVDAFGVHFANPLGLAAGYDKNGIAIRGLAALGFGHLEIGTVTVHPQAGNSRPRLHRIAESYALINSLGFPNEGAEALQRTLASGGEPILPLGINIGKGKDTPLDRAAGDYCQLLRGLYRHATYITVNVSSPNTLGLRQLQARDTMEALLKAVADQRDSLTPRVPLLVKIAPDLSASEIDDVLAAVTRSGFDGIIAANTTVSRDGVAPRYSRLPGGLSGAPLRMRALAVIRHIARATDGRLPLIGVGGIGSGDDALAAIYAGAWLVQVYTGLIYAGPGLPRSISRRLTEACVASGVVSITQLRGTEH